MIIATMQARPTNETAAIPKTFRREGMHITIGEYSRFSKRHFHEYNSRVCLAVSLTALRNDAVSLGFDGPARRSSLKVSEGPTSLATKGTAGLV